MLCPPVEGYKAAEVAATVEYDSCRAPCRYQQRLLRVKASRWPWQGSSQASMTTAYPPANPRIRIAGDLRSASYQRIATAQRSGAEAVLAYNYDTALRAGGGAR